MRIETSWALPSIPQSRLTAYIMIAGMLPLIFVVFNLLSKMGDIDHLDARIDEVSQQAFARERKQSLNMIVRRHYQDADHFYIDKQLETLSFLAPEIEMLQKLVNNKYFAGDETVKKRLEILSGKDNKLLFSESNVQKYPFFQETVVSLVRPVELNLEDLKKVLTLVEGVSIGSNQVPDHRPQLIVLDFKLDKKEATEKNDVFQLNLKLLKREFTK